MLHCFDTWKSWVIDCMPTSGILFSIQIFYPYLEKESTTCESGSTGLRQKKDQSNITALPLWSTPKTAQLWFHSYWKNSLCLVSIHSPNPWRFQGRPAIQTSSAELWTGNNITSQNALLFSHLKQHSYWLYACCKTSLCYTILHLSPEQAPAVNGTAQWWRRTKTIIRSRFRLQFLWPTVSTLYTCKTYSWLVHI